MNPQPPEQPKIFHAPSTRSRLERAHGWLICAGAAIACGVALFDFCTWWWWQDWRIGAASNTVPMAPSTALILMILGGALLLRQRWGEKAAVRLIGFVAAGIAAAPAVIVGLQHVTGVELAWEHWLRRADDTVRGIPVGHMSPLSAGAFLLAAISLAALLPPLAERRLFHRAGLVTASLGAVVSIIIALAYASGTPLFYGGGIIPMAFLTAIAFAALDLALLTAAVSGVRRRAEGVGAPPRHRAPSWRGKERNLLIVIGMLALGIALAGFFLLRAQQTAMRERIADQLETIADLKVGQIVDWRNERLGDARLMQTPLLARSAATFFANPDSAARGEILAFIDSLQRSYRYDAIVLFDHRMNLRLAVPPAAETSGPRLHALLEAVPGASDVLASDLHRGVSGDIHLDLVAPIRDFVARPSGQNPDPTQSAATPVGAMLLRINPRDFLYPLIQKWPVPSETGETLLVRREGDEVVYLNDLRHQPGSALTLRRSIRDWQLPEVKGARGLSGVTEAVDYRGVAVLAAVRAVPRSPWILVAKQDQAEIYAPLRRQALAVGTTVMVLLLGAALVAANLWRQITMNFLHRELAAETERRSLAERLALVTRHANDIILLLDETGRIVEANDRALAAYGYTLDELRQLPPGGLRPPVAMENLTQQLALFGSADGAVFETVHQRRDGTTFPLEVSGRAVEIEGRQFSLGIYRDLTERKRAEAERERLIGELRETLAEVKILGGLLPICAGCKKIRDDQGYWNQVEVYIQKHTNAKFTHGMCPVCIKKYYPGLNQS